MFGKQFVLNEQTLPIIQEIGRHIPDGFFIYRAGGGEELLYINEALLGIYGCGDLDEFKALTGYSFRGMVFPEDYEQVSGAVLRQIRGGEQDPDHVDYRIIRKDGEILWLYESGRWLLADPCSRLYVALICRPPIKARFAPLLRSPQEQASPDAAASPLLRLNALRLSGRRVLLAEDQPVNAEIAAEVLSLAGLEVDWAEDGRQCLARFLTRPEGYYDLIFMDIQMPVMNGYEAARSIRSLGGGRGARIPIIALTANVLAEDIQACIRSGMNGHLSKPIDLDAMADVLRKWIPA